MGTSDLLLGEVLEYGQRVAAAGARAVEVNVYDGMWHVFQAAYQGCGAGRLEAAVESYGRIAAFLKAFSGRPGAQPPFPERLGFAKVAYRLRFPSGPGLAALKDAMLGFGR